MEDGEIVATKDVVPRDKSTSRREFRLNLTSETPTSHIADTG
jgi:hypothetical protein